MTTVNFAELYAKAKAAGLEAGNTALPTPMTVTEEIGSNPGRSWYVPEGMCGFAWVNVKPGNSKFANWLKRNGHARTDSYYGGVTLWISEHGQSIERKEAHAKALSKVFEEAGFRSHWNSRLD